MKTTHHRAMACFWGFLVGFFACTQVVSIYGYNEQYEGSVTMAIFSILLLIFWNFVENKIDNKE